ncbi:MAG: hypothetical protein E7436_00675 [Ruminococcaceae bacterium]|nr:hypothetical protein [Oscillospiraceae bacterium]
MDGMITRYQAEMLALNERVNTMKKIICLLLSVVLVFLCGCTQEEVTPTTDPTEPSEPTKPLVILGSEVFTDAFFEDVVEISAFGCPGVVSKEQMGPVVDYFQRLNLVETDSHLSNVNENGELLYGLGFITFQKSDGTTLLFLNNHGKMTLSDGSLSYLVVGDNLNSGLREAFERALSDNDE